MDRDDIADAIEEMYRARATNDAARVFNLFADGATFRIAGTSAISGTHCGRDIATALQAIVANWRWVDHRIVSTAVEEDRAAIQYRVRLRHQPSGQVLETEILDLVTFEDDGRIAMMEEFADTAAVEKILSP